MKAVIMAAGKSTRTYPLTITRPKPLLTIANATLLEHQLDALKGLVDSVILVVGYQQEKIRARFGSRYEGIGLEYVEQAEQKGTGHAIALCAEQIEGPFLTINGDDIYDPGDLAHLAASAQAALARHVTDPRLYGIYEVDAEKRVIRIVEKPQEVFSTLANIGAYKFTPEVFEVLASIVPSTRGEIEITSAIQALAERGNFHIVESTGYWLPVVFPWNLLDANTYLLDNQIRAENYGEVHEQAVISGTVSIGRGTWIRSGVVIDGPVCIGEDSEIGPNCWIRPGTTIGNRCRVGQGCEIKNSILMDGAKASHQNYVGDSVLGEDVNLGCGTVTANLRHDAKSIRSLVKGEFKDTGRRKLGSIIGDHVHTGIHTSILPGRKLWPSTTTSPGQVVDHDITE